MYLLELLTNYWLQILLSIAAGGSIVAGGITIRKVVKAPIKKKKLVVKQSKNVVVGNIKAGHVHIGDKNEIQHE